MSVSLLIVVVTWTISETLFLSLPFHSVAVYSLALPQWILFSQCWYHVSQSGVQYLTFIPLFCQVLCFGHHDTCIT